MIDANRTRFFDFLFHFLSPHFHFYNYFLLKVKQKVFKYTVEYQYQWFYAKKGGRAVNGDFIALIEESHALNADLFSLTRLQLLAGLSDLGRDGATYSELKSSLKLTDGALYANLKVLEDMGYLKVNEVALEGKTNQAYFVTPEGIAAWSHIKNWLKKLAEFGGKTK